MPNVLRVPEDWSVNAAYANVKQTYQTLGEEFIALRMYHVNTDEGVQPRCTHCYDDIYNQNDNSLCEFCYGTTFEGGVKEVWRIWGVFADQDQDEEKLKTGVWQNEDHQAQFEPHPDLNQNDYVRRVKKWDSSKQKPTELGAYFRLGVVAPVTIRTGARYGQTDEDRIAQKAKVFLMPKSEVIYKYNIMTDVIFPRYDNQQR